MIVNTMKRSKLNIRKSSGRNMNNSNNINLTCGSNLDDVSAMSTLKPM